MAECSFPLALHSHHEERQWILFQIMLPLLLLLLPSRLVALENGLARTPPMGWMSWERFRCNTDCKNDPENCIGERLFRQMGDMLVNLLLELLYPPSYGVHIASNQTPLLLKPEEDELWMSYLQN